MSGETEEVLGGTEEVFGGIEEVLGGVEGPKRRWERQKRCLGETRRGWGGVGGLGWGAKMYADVLGGSEELPGGTEVVQRRT